MIDIKNIKRFPVLGGPIMVVKHYKVFIPAHTLASYEVADNCDSLPLWLQGESEYTVIPYSGPKNQIEKELLDFVDSPYSGLL